MNDTKSLKGALEVGTKFSMVLKLVRECMCAPKWKTKGEEIISIIIYYVIVLCLLIILLQR